MIMARVLGLLLAVLLPAPDDAHAADDVRDWLTRMEHAVASISYRGTMVSVRDGRLDTLAVYHRADDDGIRERIVTLNGPEREILRDRDSVQSLVSGDSPMVVDNPFPTRLLPRISFEVLDHPDGIYRARVGPRARVAGRSARVIEILPVDGFRYGRRLWLDERTAMLLRSVLLDADGKVLQDLAFVELELGARISDRELSSGLADPARITRYRDADDPREPAFAATQDPYWMPESLPAGFRLVSVGRTLGDEAESLEHLLFSDGLSSFSIYIEPVRDRRVAEHLDVIGSMNVYTGRIDDRIVTVVGEVPARTVRSIGQHVRRAEHPSMRHFR
ncbi:MucB/RseB C-terminal domain-containing protein [Halomonas denitrificans]|nr:MucB/RseB C-terminal domain-containing protein [Halomonas denitrificans]